MVGRGGITEKAVDRTSREGKLRRINKISGLVDVDRGEFKLSKSPMAAAALQLGLR